MKRILMISCEETSVRISRQLDGKLGVGQKLGMLGHLAICVNCRGFRRQVQILRQAFRNLPETPNDKTDSV